MRILYALALLVMVTGCKKDEPTPNENIPCENYNYVFFNMEDVRINNNFISSEHRNYGDFIVFNSDSSCFITVYIIPSYTSNCSTQNIKMMQESKNGAITYKTYFFKDIQTFVSFKVKGMSGDKFYFMTQGNERPFSSAWYHVN